MMSRQTGGSPGNGTGRVGHRTELVAAHRSFHGHRFSKNSKEGGGLFR